MKVGDLVFDLPFGKEWYKNNPWLSGKEIGIVLKLVDATSVLVSWPSGKITMTDITKLEVTK